MPQAPWQVDLDGDGYHDSTGEWVGYSGGGGTYDPWSDASPDVDTDGDGVSDFDEVWGYHIYYDQVTTYGFDEYNYDTGETVWREMTVTTPTFEWINTNPTVADTDGDYLPDGWERTHGYRGNHPGDGFADEDGDGLNNGMEYQLGTDFWLPDTDGDGLSDFAEWLGGSNPLDPADPPLPPEEDEEGDGGESGGGTAGGSGSSGSGGGGLGSGSGGDGSGSSGEGGGGNGGGGGGGSPGGGGSSPDGESPTPRPTVGLTFLENRLWGGPSSRDLEYREGWGQSEYETKLSEGWKSEYYYSQDIIVGVETDEFGAEVYIYETQVNWTVSRMIYGPAFDRDYVVENGAGQTVLMSPEYIEGIAPVGLPIQLQEFSPSAESSASLEASYLGATMYGSSFPTGDWDQVWLQATGPVPETVSQRFLTTTTTTNNFGGTPAVTHGIVSFTIPEGDTRSAQASFISGSSSGGEHFDGGNIILGPAPPDNGWVRRVTLDPITILQVGDGDRDSDGVPDFADGIEDVFPDEGLVPEDAAGDRQPESGGFHQLPLDFLGYPVFTRIRIHYPLSDPFQIQRHSQPGPGQPEFEPAPGLLRLWSRDPALPVGGVYTPRTEDDLLRPNVEVPVLDLAGGIHVESVRPSVTEGDQIVRVEIDRRDGSPLEVRLFAFTSVGIGFHAVLEDGTTEPIPGMEGSLPSPVIGVTNFQVTGSRPSPDGQGLLADITVSGTVTSMVCDITPGDLGQITAIHASVNSEPAPDRSVAVNANKGSNPDDLRRPYPYSGSFSRTFTGVPVIEGNNVFALLATDPVYRLPGSVRVPFTIEATPPAGVLTERSLAAEFPSATNGLAASQIRLTHIRDGVRVIDDLVLQSVGSTRYESPDGAIALQMAAAPALDDAVIEILSGTVSDDDSDWDSEHFAHLTEYTPDGSIFIASNGGVETVSYEGWDVTVDEIGPAESPGAGEFRPMVLKLSGPPTILDSVHQLEIGDTSVPVVERDGSHYAARADDEDRVATLIVTPIKPLAAGDLDPMGSESPDYENLPDDVPDADLDAAMAVLDRSDPDWVDLAERLRRGALRFGSDSFSDKADLKYYQGLGGGFLGNPADTGSELWGLAKGGVKLAAKAVMHSPGFFTFKVIWEFTGGDRFEGEIQAACAFQQKVVNAGQAALSYWPQVRDFLYGLRTKSAQEIAEFLATGQFPGSEKIGPAMELAMFAVLNLYLSAMDWWNGLEPYKRGYYQGYILFEVVAAVVAGIITAEVGGAGAAVVLARHAPKFGALLRKVSHGLGALAAKAGDDLGPILAKLDDFIARITGAKAGGWCFVAGTMILTAQGSVPIEQIREGDLVWSAHETTGEIGLAPVMELYRNEVEEIWTVRYAGDGEGAALWELHCTGEHPFWSEEDGAFVPAAELKPGLTLRLFGGEGARVASVTPQRGPPGMTKRVYNFAVAGHHTYHVGEGGVWVHNVCGKILDEYTAFHKTHLDDLTEGAPPTPAQWDEAFESILLKLRADSRVPENEYGDVIGSLLTNPPAGVPRIGTLVKSPTFTVTNKSWESDVSGLRYITYDEIVNGELVKANRVKHLLRHAEDIPTRKKHGVFDIGPKGFLKVVDEAWFLKQSDPALILKYTTGVSPKTGGTREVFVIEMGRRIGFEGGMLGAQAGFPAATKLRIIVDDVTDVVSAFPVVNP